MIESSATAPIHAALELRVPPMPPHAEVAQCICFDDMGHAGWSAFVSAINWCVVSVELMLVLVCVLNIRVIEIPNRWPLKPGRGHCHSTRAYISRARALQRPRVYSRTRSLASYTRPTSLSESVRPGAGARASCSPLHVYLPLFHTVTRQHTFLIPIH